MKKPYQFERQRAVNEFRRPKSWRKAKDLGV